MSGFYNHQGQYHNDDGHDCLGEGHYYKGKNGGMTAMTVKAMMVKAMMRNPRRRTTMMAMLMTFKVIRP
jgi:hypothetical protein